MYEYGIGIVSLWWLECITKLDLVGLVVHLIW